LYSGDRFVMGKLEYSGLARYCITCRGIASGVYQGALNAQVIVKLF
jgi:hypothetical protein